MVRIATLLLAVAAGAQDWPRFRGPNGAGVAADTGLPVEFGPSKNVIWKTALPRGASSPVVAGDRIFLTGDQGDDLITFCLNRADGRVLWRRAVAADRQEKLHKLNNRASSTPVADGRNVYVFFGDFGLLSYGPDGEERWRMRLGPFTNLHGMAASPVLAGRRLIMNVDQDMDSYLLAVDKDSGRAAWRTERAEVVHGFSTPIVHQGQVIVPGSYQLIAYSADNGKKLWWAGGVTWQVKSTPVIGDDVLYFNGWAPGGDAGEQYDLPTFAEALTAADTNRDGKLAPGELPRPWQPTGTWDAIDMDNDGLLDERDWHFFRSRRAAKNNLMAVRLGGSGDVTASHVLWRFSRSIPDVPSPLYYKGALWLVRTGGIATSLDPRTGEIFKQARLTGALDGYYASPVGGDGKVYMTSEAGKVVVLKAEPQWEIVAVNDFGEEMYATPAIAGSRMYVRTASALYCFGLR
jgi:outer membrane protein assembly factor BamB